MQTMQTMQFLLKDVTSQQRVGTDCSGKKSDECKLSRWQQASPVTCACDVCEVFKLLPEFPTGHNSFTPGFGRSGKLAVTQS